MTAFHEAARSNESNTLQRLLSQRQGDFDINCKDHMNRTALEVACWEASTEAAEFLYFYEGSDTGRVTFQMAAVSGSLTICKHVVKIFKEKGGPHDINARVPSFVHIRTDGTGISVPPKEEGGCDDEMDDEEEEERGGSEVERGPTALMIAAGHSKAMFNLFLSVKGVDAAKSSWTSNALIEACRGGVIENVRTLLTLRRKRILAVQPSEMMTNTCGESKGEEVNETAKETESVNKNETEKSEKQFLFSVATRAPRTKRSVLHAAYSSRHVPVVQMLLLLGADKNAVDAEGRTPLFCAVPDLNIMKLLLGAWTQGTDSTAEKAANAVAAIVGVTPLNTANLSLPCRCDVVTRSGLNIIGQFLWVLSERESAFNVHHSHSYLTPNASAEVCQLLLSRVPSSFVRDGLESKECDFKYDSPLVHLLTRKDERFVAAARVLILSPHVDLMVKDVPWRKTAFELAAAFNTLRQGRGPESVLNQPELVEAFVAAGAAAREPFVMVRHKCEAAICAPHTPATLSAHLLALGEVLEEARRSSFLEREVVNRMNAQPPHVSLINGLVQLLFQRLGGPNGSVLRLLLHYGADPNFTLRPKFPLTVAVLSSIEDGPPCSLSDDLLSAPDPDSDGDDDDSGDNNANAAGRGGTCNATALQRGAPLVDKNEWWGPTSAGGGGLNSAAPIYSTYGAPNQPPAPNSAPTTATAAAAAPANTTNANSTAAADGKLAANASGRAANASSLLKVLIAGGARLDAFIGLYSLFSYAVARKKFFAAAVLIDAKGCDISGGHADPMEALQLAASTDRLALNALPDLTPPSGLGLDSNTNDANSTRNGAADPLRFASLMGTLNIRAGNSTVGGMWGRARESAEAQAARREGLFASLRQVTVLTRRYLANSRRFHDIPIDSSDMTRLVLEDGGSIKEVDCMFDFAKGRPLVFRFFDRCAESFAAERWEAFRLALDAGMEVHAVSDSGVTPIEAALKSPEWMPMACLLLLNGAVATAAQEKTIRSSPYYAAVLAGLRAQAAAQWEKITKERRRQRRIFND